jgi:hypothetical protein
MIYAGVASVSLFDSSPALGWFEISALATDLCPESKKPGEP